MISLSCTLSLAFDRKMAEIKTGALAGERLNPVDTILLFVISIVYLHACFSGFIISNHGVNIKVTV
jgi:hypothetical protein